MAFNKIADVFVEIKGDKGKFSNTIRGAKRETSGFARSATKSLKSVAKGLGAMGAVAAVAAVGVIALATALTVKLGRGIFDITKKSATLGDEFHKMSLRVGESAERLSALKFAADISGSAMAEVELGLRRLSQNMNDFSTGTGEAKQTFEALGVQVIDTNGNLRSSIDVMLDVADGLNNLKSESQKTAFAQELFGRSGAKLLPLLKEGSSGIKILTDRAAALGLVIGDKAAAASAEFNDRLTELTSSIEMVKFKIGSALIPVIQPLIEHFTDVASEVSGVVGSLAKLVPVWQDYKKEIATVFKEIAVIILQTTGEMMKGVFAIMNAAAPLLFKPLKNAAGKYFRDFATGFSLSVNDMMRSARLITQKEHDRFLAEVVDSNKNANSKAAENFRKEYESAIQSAVNTSIAELPKIGAAFGDSLSEILGLITDLTDKIPEVSEGLLEPVKKAAAELARILPEDVDFLRLETEDPRKAVQRHVEALQRIADFRKELDDEMSARQESNLEKFREFLRQREETAKANLEKMKAMLEEQRQAAIAVAQAIQPAFESMFAGLISGETKGVWTAFWQDLRRIAIRELATIFATQLLAGIFTGGASFGAIGLGSAVSSFVSSSGTGSPRGYSSAMPPGGHTIGTGSGRSMGRASFSIGTMIIQDQDLTNFDTQRMARQVEQGIGPALAVAAADGI